MIELNDLKIQVDGIKLLAQQLEETVNSFYHQGRIIEEEDSIKKLRAIQRCLYSIQVIINKTVNSIIQTRIEIEQKIS